MTEEIRPQDLNIKKEVFAYIDKGTAERYGVCPLAIKNVNGTKILAIGMADTGDISTIDKVQAIAGCKVQPVQVSPLNIKAAIKKYYVLGEFDDDARPVDLLKEMGQMAPPTPVNTQVNATSLVEEMLLTAAKERTSDIHVEVFEKECIIRFRVDGVLYDHSTYNPEIHPQVISRIKILAHLDIGQNRLPQDGRFQYDSGGGKILDVRVSVVPSHYGEKVVMRLLPKDTSSLNFDNMGISGFVREKLMEYLHRPFGMILVTGPTGSGKSTSLYAALNDIDSVKKNVITIEDPIEFSMPRITQIQVHQKIGMNFASGLRAILRQDPDVIMVGEIRDLETLQIAMQSALTGHLVLSTLHSNDSAAAAARMVDMGAESFLIASATSGIMAQRLVRAICPHCKAKDNDLSEIVKERAGIKGDGYTYYKGIGCDKCRGTGTLGRKGLFEILPFTDEIQQAVIKQQTASEIRAIARSLKIPSILDSGIEKAREGVISIEEMMRAVLIDD